MIVTKPRMQWSSANTTS